MNILNIANPKPLIRPIIIYIFDFGHIVPEKIKNILHSVFVIAIFRNTKVKRPVRKGFCGIVPRLISFVIGVFSKKSYTHCCQSLLTIKNSEEIIRSLSIVQFIDNCFVVCILDEVGNKLIEIPTCFRIPFNTPKEHRTGGIPTHKRVKEHPDLVCTPHKISLESRQYIVIGVDIAHRLIDGYWHLKSGHRYSPSIFSLIVYSRICIDNITENLRYSIFGSCTFYEWMFYQIHMVLTQRKS